MGQVGQRDGSLCPTLKSGTNYTAKFTYDARGQLTRVYDLNNNNRYYNYTYDARGNITKSTYSTSATGINFTNQNTYHYNDAIPDELSSVEMKVGSATTTREYTYDTIGNPTSHSEPSPMALWRK